MRLYMFVNVCIRAIELVMMTASYNASLGPHTESEIQALIFFCLFIDWEKGGMHMHAGQYCWHWARERIQGPGCDEFRLAHLRFPPRCTLYIPCRCIKLQSHKLRHDGAFLSVPSPSAALCHCWLWLRTSLGAQPICPFQSLRLSGAAPIRRVLLQLLSKQHLRQQPDQFWWPSTYQKNHWVARRRCWHLSADRFSGHL